MFMTDYHDLARKLLQDGEVTLEYDRYNDGSDEESDILVNHVYAVVEKGNITGEKDIAVYLAKEDDSSVFETHELYRFPFLSNIKVLGYLLGKANKQSHLD